MMGEPPHRQNDIGAVVHGDIIGDGVDDGAQFRYIFKILSNMAGSFLAKDFSVKKQMTILYQHCQYSAAQESIHLHHKAVEDDADHPENGISQRDRDGPRPRLPPQQKEITEDDGEKRRESSADQIEEPFIPFCRIIIAIARPRAQTTKETAFSLPGRIREKLTAAECTSKNVVVTVENSTIQRAMAGSPAASRIAEMSLVPA